MQRYLDELNSSLGGINNNRNYSIKDSQIFGYKTSITGKLKHNYREKQNVEIVVPLNYLNNFWRTLDMSLINCEVFLILTWSKNCILASKEYRPTVPNQGGNPAVAGIENPTATTFTITDTRLYVPAVTLSNQDDKRLLQQLKTGLKRIIKWNKYRSEMSIQPKNSNSNHLIDPTFTKVNRLFVL